MGEGAGLQIEAGCSAVSAEFPPSPMEGQGDATASFATFATSAASLSI